MPAKKSYTIQVKIPVIFLKEGDQFVAHSPALDVATAATTYEDVKKRFSESVEIFFEELIEKGTLNEVLQELGWQKIKQQWQPPIMIGHESESVTLPMPA